MSMRSQSYQQSKGGVTVLLRGQGKEEEAVKPVHGNLPVGQRPSGKTRSSDGLEKCLD